MAFYVWCLIGELRLVQPLSCLLTRGCFCDSSLKCAGNEVATCVARSTEIAVFISRFGGRYLLLKAIKWELDLNDLFKDGRIKQAQISREY